MVALVNQQDVQTATTHSRRLQVRCTLGVGLRIDATCIGAQRSDEQDQSVERRSWLQSASGRNTAVSSMPTVATICDTGAASARKGGPPQPAASHDAPPLAERVRNRR
jgi:hypothetical protein